MKPKAPVDRQIPDADEEVKARSRQLTGPDENNERKSLRSSAGKTPFANPAQGKTAD